MTAEDPPQPSLTRRTVAGLQWSYLQTAVSAVLQLGMAAVLARVLTPKAFGLVALGDLSLRLVNYLARAGVTQAIVQKRDLTDADIRAGWTLSVGLGIVFAAVVWFLAPLGAVLFDAPDVTPVLRWMGLDLVLFGLGATADALLRRRMRFKTLALRDIASYVVGYPIVGLTLALNGAGVWALVAAVLTQSGLRSILAWLAVRHDLRPTVDRGAHRSVLAFGSRVSLISLLEFLGGELDTFAVGRYAGTSALGLYNRAYLLARLPTYQITTSLSKVLFPAFSEVQQEVDRLRSALLSAIRVTAAVVVPIAAGIAVAAPEIVRVLLGEDWVGAIPVLPYVAGAAGLSMLTHFLAIAAEARAELDRKLVISGARLVVLVGLLALAVGEDLWAYGAALLGSKVFAHLAYLRLGRRVADLRPSTVVRAYAPALLAGALVAAAVAGVRLAVAAVTSSPLVVLAAEIATGAVVLVVSLRVGVLAGARRELAARLALAGTTEGAGRGARLARALVGSPER